MQNFLKASSINHQHILSQDAFQHQSQNHRISEVARNLWRSSGPPPLPNLQPDCAIDCHTLGLAVHSVFNEPKCSSRPYFISFSMKILQKIMLKVLAKSGQTITTVWWPGQTLHPRSLPNWSSLASPWVNLCDYCSPLSCPSHAWK